MAKYGTTTCHRAAAVMAAMNLLHLRLHQLVAAAVKAAMNLLHLHLHRAVAAAHRAAVQHHHLHHRRAAAVLLPQPLDAKRKIHTGVSLVSGTDGNQALF